MNKTILEIVGRKKEIFGEDIKNNDRLLTNSIANSRFLVIGGAGSIGSAVVLEIFKRSPQQLHVVDISENNLVEVVRNIRSSLGYIKGEFKTFAIDCGSSEFEALFRQNRGYDYVLNLSALKHVRSESNPFTLMRMLRVNVENALTVHQLCKEFRVKKYFCVSSDKAANPANMMGATKRLMEKALFSESTGPLISMARFANVAFSDGSLLHGFRNRLLKTQPISAPKDVKRYFMTDSEAGLLCLFSCICGQRNDVFFPISSEEINLISLDKVAINFLKANGLASKAFTSEDEARKNCTKLAKDNIWACYFFNSDTTGEKAFEEFYTKDETVITDEFKDIGIVRNNATPSILSARALVKEIRELYAKGQWCKSSIVEFTKHYVPEFQHIEKNKYLDEKM